MVTVKRSQALYRWLQRLRAKCDNTTMGELISKAVGTASIPFKKLQVLVISDEMLAAMIEMIRGDSTRDCGSVQSQLYELEKHLVRDDGSRTAQQQASNSPCDDRGSDVGHQTYSQRSSMRPDMSFSSILRESGSALHLGAGVVTAALLGYFSALVIFYSEIGAAGGVWPPHAIWTAIVIGLVVIGLDLALILTRLCRSAMPTSIPRAVKARGVGIAPFEDPKPRKYVVQREELPTIPSVLPSSSRGPASGAREGHEVRQRKRTPVAVAPEEVAEEGSKLGTSEPSTYEDEDGELLLQGPPPPLRSRESETSQSMRRRQPRPTERHTQSIA